MLKREIEAKRKKMIAAAKRYGFQSKRTIRISQELDKLIFLYQKTSNS
ncbi:hypothetical protein DCC39_00200 [Pueribacillus theae]|uniref:Aspartyl-phosphate phosphatase Spo0E family protein n=1 Tax=Pueribacillus theae TaxID=2171751 RepID=A0A2U1K7I6_9BACI|nr:aspartyl-phosphate phosphatase Spo0E family protein [Pueribacillus theae]PWA13352.1 hypothetical protein DCC39_00200 [Pueribacillus theae]